MHDEVWVLVVEDDPYARDLMVMVLTRDWRTRVVAETTDEQSAATLLQDCAKRVDVILLDTEIPRRTEWRLPATLLDKRNPAPPVLCIGTQVSEAVWVTAVQPPCCGYLLKQEVQYGLAEAVWRAAQGQWVTTPTVRLMARQARWPAPSQVVVLDGTLHAALFTPRERHVARLALLFGLSRREIADELQFHNPEEVGNLVTRVYRKLELPELLQGQVAPEVYFSEGKVLDLYSRFDLGRRLSNMLDGVFCLTALELALRDAQPDISDTDQGVQITALDFTGTLETAHIRVRMDGRGCAFDSIFIERFGRLVKYEDLCNKEYGSVPTLMAGLETYSQPCNHEQPYQSLGYLALAVIHLTCRFCGPMIYLNFVDLWS